MNGLKSTSEVSRRSTTQDDLSRDRLIRAVLREMRAVRDLITQSVVARNQRDALTQAGAGIAAFRVVG